jgi:hypothetical protein
MNDLCRVCREPSADEATCTTFFGWSRAAESVPEHAVWPRVHCLHGADVPSAQQ